MEKVKSPINFGIILDLVLILFTIGLAYIPAEVIPLSYLIAYALVAPLQALALCNMQLLPQGFKPAWLNVFQGLLMVLGAGAFLWLFMPALAIGNKVGWGIFMAAFFISIFGGILAVGVFPFQRPKWADTTRGIILLRSSALLYLSISEFLLYQTAHFYQGKIPLGVIILTLFVSYFPVRWLMIKKEPFNKIELLTALAAIGWLIFRLF